MNIVFKNNQFSRFIEENRNSFKNLKINSELEWNCDENHNECKFSIVGNYLNSNIVKILNKDSDIID